MRVPQIDHKPRTTPIESFTINPFRASVKFEKLKLVKRKATIIINEAFPRSGKMLVRVDKESAITITKLSFVHNVF